MTTQNLLVELFVEELPPKALQKLGDAFAGVLFDQLQAQGLTGDDSGVTAYASPLKMMEYLVLGKAIVAPDMPNIREILNDGENAVLFDEKEPGSLEAALTRVCSEAALRERLAVNASATIDRLQLTWLGNARRVAALVAGLRK